MRQHRVTLQDRPRVSHQHAQEVVAVVAQRLLGVGPPPGGLAGALEVAPRIPPGHARHNRPIALDLEHVDRLLALGRFLGVGNLDRSQLGQPVAQRLDNFSDRSEPRRTGQDGGQQDFLGVGVVRRARGMDHEFSVGQGAGRERACVRPMITPAGQRGQSARTPRALAPVDARRPGSSPPGRSLWRGPGVPRPGGIGQWVRALAEVHWRKCTGGSPLARVHCRECIGGSALAREGLRRLPAPASGPVREFAGTAVARAARPPAARTQTGATTG